MGHPRRSVDVVEPMPNRPARHLIRGLLGSVSPRKIFSRHTGASPHHPPVYRDKQTPRPLLSSCIPGYRRLAALSRSLAVWRHGAVRDIERPVQSSLDALMASPCDHHGPASLEDTWKERPLGFSLPSAVPVYRINTLAGTKPPPLSLYPGISPFLSLYTGPRSSHGHIPGEREYAHILKGYDLSLHNTLSLYTGCARCRHTGTTRVASQHRLLQGQKLGYPCIQVLVAVSDCCGTVSLLRYAAEPSSTVSNHYQLCLRRGGWPRHGKRGVDKPETGGRPYRRRLTTETKKATSKGGLSSWALI